MVKKDAKQSVLEGVFERNIQLKLKLPTTRAWISDHTAVSNMSKV